MKLLRSFDEVTFYGIFGLIVVAVVFFTIFWGNV